MCDTFVALPSATADGALIFGKNSDREPNEAQVLEYHPAADHPPGAKVRCTYIEIPQTSATNEVLLSRPFWMWGAEMGANQHGVVIGNEAVWSRMPLNRGAALTGMDLLRLSLERAASAQQALEVMVQLLADHGQGGICGFEDKKATYHNSYIIADPGEAWVLETAGPLWAAIKVRDVYAISNGFTIGEQLDEQHPDLIETARRNGWLKRGETFHFAHCYADWFYHTFTACRHRRRRSLNSLKEERQRFDLRAAMGLLRDHGTADYRPDRHLLVDRLCAHAANPVSRHATQSTGSFIAHLMPRSRTYWATGTSAPCTGVFKPLWFEGPVLPSLGVPTGRCDRESWWWRHERLHRAVLLDFSARLAAFCDDRAHLEEQFLRQATETTDPWGCTQSAFARAATAREEWLARVQDMPLRRRPLAYYRLYWRRQNRKAGMATER